MANGYPIVLDLVGRLVVIVGGGPVALRKATGLLACGADRIRVISPAFHAEMPSQVQRIAGFYEPRHLEGASLVFAATDRPEVNDAVVRDAHRIGALACRADIDDDADSGAAGDFATPAMRRQGLLLLTVSSGGSPALSAMIRDRLAEAIDPRWARLADATHALRPVIRRRLPQSRRREVFQELCSEQAINELSQNGIDGLRRWLGARYPELNG